MSCSSPWLLQDVFWGQDCCSCAGQGMILVAVLRVMRNAAGYQVCGGQHTGAAGCYKQSSKTTQPRVMPHLSLWPFPLCFAFVKQVLSHLSSNPGLSSMFSRAW